MKKRDIEDIVFEIFFELCLTEEIPDDVYSQLVRIRDRIKEIYKAVNGTIIYKLPESQKRSADKNKGEKNDRI